MQIEVEFTHDGLERYRGGDIDIAVFRIIQEAITNAARHAQIHKAKVRLWQDDRSIDILIQDQGVGFDADRALRQKLSGGLSGMMERVEALSGVIDIESEPDAGVRIAARLPLTNTPPFIREGKAA
jgi:signal transduction histidine kinase